MPKDSICDDFSLHFVATEVVCLLMLVCKKAAMSAEGSTCQLGLGSDCPTLALEGDRLHRLEKQSLGEEIWALLFLF